MQFAYQEEQQLHCVNHELSRTPTMCLGCDISFMSQAAQDVGAVPAGQRWGQEQTQVCLSRAQGLDRPAQLTRRIFAVKISPWLCSWGRVVQAL